MKRWLAFVVASLALVAVAGCGSDGAGDSATPRDSSPEAGFARDMSVHHAQAVAMAEAIRGRTSDPDLRLLATDIALGQQRQIGRMSGWLDEWQLPQTSTAAPMVWIRVDNLLDGATMAGMDHGGSDMSVGPGELMPGMA